METRYKVTMFSIDRSPDRPFETAEVSDQGLDIILKTYNLFIEHPIDAVHCLDIDLYLSIEKLIDA
jgi:hypothetical protein